jgi:hypothetical protein
MFIQRNPDASRAEALQTARNLLCLYGPSDEQHTERYHEAACLFLMYKDDNELGMAGAEEVQQLADQLKELALQWSIFQEITTGFFLPAIDEKGNMCFYPVPEHEWDETGISKDYQNQYKQIKIN